ncbi:hypothetical protein BY996DRAFT_6531638, partial [Phakopsora pachyrhizi]
MTEGGVSELDNMENGFFKSELETIEEASQRVYTEEILIIMDPAFIRYKIYCSNEFLDL